MFFLDNASTTRCDEESAEIVKNALIDDYFNPSAKYFPAVHLSSKLNECRKEILDTLFAINYDVIFTASATEANNLVLNSACSKAYKSIVSLGEHSSIYETTKLLRNKGFEIEELKLNRDGTVDVDNFREIIQPNVGFVSVMLVSNETGAINDCKKLVAYAKSVNPKILFHIDAVQGYCKLPINLEDIGADYMTISSHKIHGPKGVGALIAKKKSKLTPQIIGGGQENGIRSGTENLPAIVGFVNSAKKQTKDIVARFERVLTYKKTFYELLIKKAKAENIEVTLNGSMETSSPYILSISFPHTKAEILLHSLESYDILVGTGSACNSKHKGNRVLSEMGKNDLEVEGNIRISFSEESLSYDAEYITDKIIECVTKIKRK